MRTLAFILYAGILAGGLAAIAAMPRMSPLPVEKSLPTVTITGYIVGEFNVWGQWNNQTKVFDVVDDIVVRTRTYKLAFASEAMYRVAERSDGQAVAIKAVRANREDNEWYVVQSLRVIE